MKRCTACGLYFDDTQHPGKNCPAAACGAILGTPGQFEPMPGQAAEGRTTSTTNDTPPTAHEEKKGLFSKIKIKTKGDHGRP